MMDNSIDALRLQMAHLPIDRASEHPFSAQQTESSSLDPIYHINSPQPYNPGHQAEHWSRFRSHQTMTMAPLHQPTFPNPYVVDSGQYDANAHHDYPHQHSQAAYVDTLYTHSRPDSTMANPCMGSATSEGTRQFKGHSDWTELQSLPVFKGDEICQFSTHLQPVHAVQHIPPSPLSTISSYESPESLIIASPTMTVQIVDQLSPESSEDDREDRPGPTPYSHLIFRALKEAKDNKLPLQDIYNWFEKNTDKAKSSGSKGWQNSIRHNLSMNAGFEAVKEESGPGKKSVNFWRLTPEAIHRNHVQSTTRYRKSVSATRKSLGANARAAQRQRTEAKGGNPSKALKTRHLNTSHDEPNEIYHHHPMALQSYPMDGHYPHPDPQMMPPYISPVLAPPIDNALQRYGMDSVIGCTNLPPVNNGSFYDSMGTTPGNGTFAPTHATHAGWYASQSDHNMAMMTGSDGPADLHHGV